MTETCAASTTLTADECTQAATFLGDGDYDDTFECFYPAVTAHDLHVGWIEGNPDAGPNGPDDLPECWVFWSDSSHEVRMVRPCPTIAPSETFEEGAYCSLHIGHEGICFLTDGNLVPAEGGAVVAKRS